MQRGGQNSSGPELALVVKYQVAELVKEPVVAERQSSVATTEPCGKVKKAGR